MTATMMMVLVMIQYLPQLLIYVQYTFSSSHLNSCPAAPSSDLLDIPPNAYSRSLAQMNHIYFASSAIFIVR